MCLLECVSAHACPIQLKSVVPALNRLFAESPRLEYLHINESSTSFTATASLLKLPAQLLYLSLMDHCAYGPLLLSEEACKALAPNLRSLRFRDRTYFCEGLPPHLHLLENLTFLGLCTNNSEKNTATVLSALASMSRLKALDCGCWVSWMVVHHPAGFAQAEHLELHLDSQVLKDGVEGWSGGLAELKSLIVFNCSTFWRWLEPLLEMGRLEYLDMSHGYSTVPAELVTELVRKSPVGKSPPTVLYFQSFDSEASHLESSLQAH